MVEDGVETVVEIVRKAADELSEVEALDQVLQHDDRKVSSRGCSGGLDPHHDDPGPSRSAARTGQNVEPVRWLAVGSPPFDPHVGDSLTVSSTCWYTGSTWGRS